MFLKKNERIDFGLLLKIYATKHRICIWIFKQNQNQNQPTSEQKSFSTVPSMEQQTGSKSGKECVNAVYCHPASVQFSSVSQSCLTLCNPMDRGTPGLPVHHQLLKFTQTHVHWVGNAIQPSHPPLSPSPPAQSFPASRSFPVPLDGLVRSPCSPRDSQESSSTPQFKNINSSVLSFLYSQLSHPYMTTGKTIASTRQTFVGKVMSLLFT